MKQQKQIERERVFGAVPQMITHRVSYALDHLEEERPMKKRFVPILVLITLVALAGVAYAAITVGLEWYYSNRFDAYREHAPEKYRAIMENLQTNVPQEDISDAQGLVSLTVQDYAWVDTQQVFTLSMAARATMPNEYELHPMMALDTDGLHSGSELDPDEPESRTEHWLWTKKGCGLPKDVMLDPAKKLLLVDFENLLIGDTDIEFRMTSSDMFAIEDGASIGVMEIDLRWSDDEYIRSRYQPQPIAAAVEPAVTPEPLPASYQAEMDAYCLEALDYAAKVREAIAKNTDESGNLTLRLPYIIRSLENNELSEPTQGSAIFQVKIK